MRIALIIACMGLIIATAGVDGAAAAPQSASSQGMNTTKPRPAPAAPPSSRPIAVICEKTVWGQGFFNGKTCEPQIALYKNNVKKICGPNCTKVFASDKRAYVIQQPGKPAKPVGADCDWAMYDCEP